MSDQKPVKLCTAMVEARDAWWTAMTRVCDPIRVPSLTYTAFAAGWQAAKDRPDPRDACVEALRLARAALDVSTTHRPEDREKVVAARIATESALRALDGEQS